MLKKIKYKSGYLLIEVMISVLIFSIALIGLVTLQIASYSSTQGASYRSMATNFASDMADKMRANKQGFIAGAYLGSGANNGCRTINFNTVNGAVVNCTPSQMAQDDLLELKSEVSMLPQGAAVVCLDSSQAQGTPSAPNCDGLGTVYAIKIFWKDTRSKVLNLNSGYSQVIVGVQA
jgi:type IV pilus assembly protein PilV